jgi:hypothetical protein
MARKRKLASVLEEKEILEDESYNFRERKPTTIVQDIFDCHYMDDLIAVRDGWVYVTARGRIRTTFSDFECCFTEGEQFICNQTKRNSWNNNILLKDDNQLFLIDTSGNIPKAKLLDESEHAFEHEYYLPEINSVVLWDSDGLNFAFNVCLFNIESSETRWSPFEGNTAKRIDKVVVIEGQVYLFVAHDYGQEVGKRFEVYDFRRATLQYQNVSQYWPDRNKPEGSQFKRGELLASTKNHWVASTQIPLTGEEEDLYFCGDGKSQQALPQTMYPMLKERKHTREGFGLNFYFGTKSRFAFVARSIAYLYD